MKTKQLYYTNPYKKSLGCKVVSINPKGSVYDIILDKTIFYPEGGGQPCDNGYLISKGNSIKVEYTRVVQDEIVHQTKTNVGICVGDSIKVILNWENRYRNMRVHSAGHLLHDTLTSFYPDLIPLKGGHGNKAYLIYKGIIPTNDKQMIEKLVNIELSKELKIKSEDIDCSTLVKSCPNIPENLPKNKRLRIIMIGNHPPMPDGGVHIKNTKEIGKIWIANITSCDDATNIRYGIV